MGKKRRRKTIHEGSDLTISGSNCDWDSEHAVNDVLGIPAKRIWHKDKLPSEAEAVIVPGGFSFGDYLRCGAIARFFSHHEGSIGICRHGRTSIGNLQWFSNPLRIRFVAWGSRS